jgi:hypothetical protein
MIEAKIAEYATGVPDHWARRACAEANALPLCFDWTGCLAIRPDGEVLYIDEESHAARVVEEERVRNLALFQGSRKDPDLRCLVPPRPPDAADCPDCRGTGKLPFRGKNAHLAEVVICHCGGLGWVPASSAKPAGPPPDPLPTMQYRRTVIRALLMIAAIPPTLLALSLIGLFPWSGINCTRSDIDLNSGRTRFTRYLLWLPVTRSVQDSALTRALSPDDRTNPGENWHPVVTLSPGLYHSPHYRYHGAISQIRELEICWKYGKMTPQARRETARQVLRLWHEAGSYFPADDYIQRVWELALEAEKTGKSIDVKDLPEP